MISAVAMDRVNSNLVSPIGLGQGGATGARHHLSQANGIGNIIKRDPSNLKIVNIRGNNDNEKALSS
jgi:hypothetical protein